MDLFDININNEKFKVAVADNPETRQRGLSGLERLGKNKGMLFIFPEKTNISMVMRGMNFDLDFIFLSKDWKAIELGSMSKDSVAQITSGKPCYMVLEVAKGTIEKLNLKIGDQLKPGTKMKTQFKGVSKFKHGGKFEMIGDKVYEVKVDDIDIDPTKMQILNDKGEVVSNIGSGARVFSREDTKNMIKEHKKGNKINLADLFIKIIEIQDNQKQDYVEK